MATKNTSGMTSLNNMVKNQKNTTVKKLPDGEHQAADESKAEKPENKTINQKTDSPKTEEAKKKPGRPKTKTEETKTINIAVPVSVLEKLETVKACYSNNLTLYINKLIEKDIEANYNNYKNIADSLNIFK